MKALRLFLTLALLFAFVSCSSDPDARKKKHLTNGNKYYDNGKFKEASIMYRRALKEDMRYGEGWYKLGLTELKMGRPGEAAQALRRAVELMPENNDAHSKLADLYLTAYLADTKRFKNLLPELKDIANRLSKRNPKSFDALRLNGYLALSEKDIDGAYAAFKAANEAKPDQPGLVLILAQTLYATGKAQEGENLLTDLLKKNKGYYPAYDYLYATYARAGKIDLAEKILTDKVANNPTDGSLYINLATHYFLSKKEGEMKATLNKVLADPKTFYNNYQLVGDFYYRTRDFDNANKVYEQGAQNDKVNRRSFLKRMVAVLRGL